MSEQQRTAYQHGYEDALDRGWNASGKFASDPGAYANGFRNGELKLPVAKDAELTTLRAQVAGLEKDTIVLAHAVQSWTVSEGPHTKACQEGGDSRCSACIAFECRDAVTKEAKDAVQRAIDLEEAASAVKEPA